MKNIVFSRIDDRLIHGQVMAVWLQRTGANEILIVDEELPEDSFTTMIMQSLIPKQIKLNVYNAEDAIHYLKEDDNGKEKIFILCKGPFPFKELNNNGIEISKINLGGMGINKNRTTLYKNIATSKKENQVLKELIDAGISISIQVVPTEKEIDISPHI